MAEYRNRIFPLMSGEIYDEFPANKFTKSCLIYTKNTYGIFLLEDKDGNHHVVKVNSNVDASAENSLGLYIKKNIGNIPNILTPEGIYTGYNPQSYSVFSDKNKRLNIKECQDYKELSKIFTEYRLGYSYYLTKACDYNLSYFFGIKNKGVITLAQFIGYSFQIIVGLYTLHKIGIWHKDFKPQNILICKKEVYENNITYISNSKEEKKEEKKEGNKMNWTLDYAELNNKDMKIIDFGESTIYKDVIFPCDTFKYEVNRALVTVIELMWSKTVNKVNRLLDYEDLIIRLKECKTSLIDVMNEASIFNVLRYTVNDAYNVNLL